jgi:hypothetical protein
MSFFKSDERLTKMLHVCDMTSRGVWKRIDENRELLYFLYEHAPDLFERFGFIRCWIQSNDDFFTELAEASGLESYHSGSFPRPFPSEEDLMAHKRERDDILVSYKKALIEQNRLLIENQEVIAALTALLEDLKVRLSTNKTE